jgi:glycosidase
MNYPFSRSCLGFFGGPSLDTDARPGGHRLRILGARAFAGHIDAMLAWYPWPVTLAQLNLLASHDTPRPLTLLRGSRDRYKLSLLYMMTSPGAPCIFYGDEVGLSGGPEPGCRVSMPWDTSRWDLDLRAFVRSLIAMRHRHGALRRGAYTRLYADRGVYAFARQYQGETLIVVLNSNDEAVNVEVPVRGCLANGTVLSPIVGEERVIVTAGRISSAQIASTAGLVWQAAAAVPLTGNLP